MKRKMGRPPIAPRLRRRDFKTTISPEQDDFIQAGIKRGAWESQAKFMDLVHKTMLKESVRKELEADGIPIEELTRRR